MDAGRNRPTQIDLGVQLDPGLGSTEVGPRKEGQREIDRAGIECVDGIVQLDAKIFPCIQNPCFADQAFGEILPDPPVPLFVGIRQGGSGNRTAEPQVVECRGLCIEAGDDIPQPVAPSQLSEGHADELLSTPEMPDPRVGIVTPHQTVERLAMDEIENLGQDESAGIHARKACKTPAANSNPSHRLLVVSCSS